MSAIKEGYTTSENKLQYVAMVAAVALFAGGVAVEILTEVPTWLPVSLSIVGMVSTQLASMGYTKWRTLLKIEDAKKSP